MSKNRLDISDNTAISMPVRNMLAIIGAVAVGVWAYFGVLERITMLETKSVLTEKDLDDLDNRFNKDGRDFGKIAIEKTGAINRIINKGSDNASRCIEIASGAELTEEERNATKKSEINRECPGIANPNYVPY